jgi:hypothetical protein
VAAPSKLHKDFGSLRRCWSCAADLTLQKVEPAEEPFPSARAWLNCRTATIGRAAVQGKELLGGVRDLAQFLIRKSKESPDGSSNVEVLHGINVSLGWVRAVEQLPTVARHTVLGVVAELLESWPTKFLELCERRGLRRWHFRGEGNLAYWLSEVVDTHLARQNRAVTPAKIEAALAALDEGRRTKAELRRALQWQGRRGLEGLFPTPPPPSLEDTRNLARLVAVGHREGRPHFARTLNAAAILVGLLDGRSLQEVARLTLADLISELKGRRVTGVKLADLLQDLQCLAESHRLAQTHRLSTRELANCFNEWRALALPGNGQPHKTFLQSALVKHESGAHTLADKTRGPRRLRV